MDIGHCHSWGHVHYSYNTLPSHSNMLNYNTLLLYSQLNIAEIHIVFDDPKRLKNQAIEQVRWNPASDYSQVPRKWHEIVLGCRYCKQNLVEYIGSAMLQGAMSILSGRQRLIVTGNSYGILRDTAWYSDHCNDSLPVFNVFSNAEEANTRVWLHADKSNAKKIPIFLETPTHITSAWQHHQWISLPEKWWFRLIPQQNHLGYWVFMP